MEIPSRNRTKNAGDALKRFFREGGSLRDIDPSHALHEDLLVAQEWRAQFGSAILGVRMGTASMARTCGVDANVTQRHKRVERIIQKLARPNSTALPRMQDIAGVRAVVPSLSDLRKLEAHIRSTWVEGRPSTSGVVVGLADYVETPRDSGYRALHLIVQYNGLPVELQLRTLAQQGWAEMVETVSRMIDLELKAGEEPDELRGFFQRVAVASAGLDDGALNTYTDEIDLGEWGGTTLRVVVEP